MFEINKIFKKLVCKKDLELSESELLFNLIIDKELNDVQISSVLTLLFLKGESYNEIFAAIKVLKSRAKKIDLTENGLIDTCGTGGDSKGSFNISTATAILLSVCGLKVAKHGNRSITSKSGSTDILSTLGIEIELNEKKIKKFFKKNNICFLFAPFFHSSLKSIMEIRKSLPFKTIFNLLGPLLNPSKIEYQLLGVGEKKNLLTHSECLLNANINSAWVVHSENGYDELTTTSPNLVYKINNKKISELIVIHPEEAGLKISQENEIKGGSPQENAYILRRLFEGETSAIRDNVLFNAAACLMITKKVDSLKNGVDLAAKNIDNFSAKSKLDQLIASSKDL